MLPYAAFSQDKAFSKKEPRRVYGVLGDAYLQNRVARQLIAWCLGENADADFNLDQMEGEGTSINDVMARCGQLPFLSERRVVWVQRAERLENMHRSASEEGASKSSDASKSSAGSPAKRLAEGLKKLPPTTVLILSRTPETPEIGAKKETPRCINAAVDKAIEESGLIIDCLVPAKAAEVAVQIVQNEATARDIPLQNGAAQFLVARAGTDIAALLNDLEKCALRVGIGNAVTRAVIEEMVKPQLQDTVFSLTDALGKRQTAHAIGLLRELIADGNAPEMILSLIVRHFKQLLQIRALMDAQIPLNAAASSRMPPELSQAFPQGKDSVLPLLAQTWRIGPLQQQARNFSVTQLQKALQAALETDLAMKGIEGDGGTDSKNSSSLAMELFLARL